MPNTENSFISQPLPQPSVRWNGSGSTVNIQTVPYGLYLNETNCESNESTFEADCLQSAKWAAMRLGYPIISIEMIDINFYACFEQAVMEYNRQINEFNIINNLIDLIGTDKSAYENLTGMKVIGSGLPFMVEISRMYGTEANVGGKVKLHRGVVPIQGSFDFYADPYTSRPSVNQQTYDLNKIFADQNEDIDGSRIEVRRVFHHRPAAAARIYDPFSMTGMSYSNVLTEMGFASYSPATQFLMTPIFEDLERIQAIDFNDMVRKSAFSFEITGDNMLRIFPIPTYSFKLYIDYYIEKDKIAGHIQSTQYDQVTDPSDVPYNVCKYCKINQPGKQWIRKYFLALCKETLGIVRQKYSTIPIPGDSVQLDGGELRAEAQREMETLIDELKGWLEKTLRVNQLENKSKETEVLKDMLKNVPLHIYIG